MQAFQPLQEQLDDLRANQEYLYTGKDTWQPGDGFKTYENYTTKDSEAAVHCDKEYANLPPAKNGEMRSPECILTTMTSTVSTALWGTLMTYMKTQSKQPTKQGYRGACGTRLTSHRSLCLRNQPNPGYRSRNSCPGACPSQG